MNFSWFLQRLKHGAIFFAIFLLAVGLLYSPKIIRHFKKPTPSSQISIAGNQYPLIVRDATGQEVVIENKPERIVALSPSITEILYALHAEGRLVGNSRYCVYPPQAKTIRKVGGINDPSIEALKSLKPDVVLCTILTPTRIIQTMQASGLKVVTFDHQRVEEAERDILLIGRIIGIEDEATLFLSNFHHRFETIKRRAQELPRRPNAIILYGLDSLHIAGIDSFSGEILKISGGVNLGEQTGLRWTQLSMERLVKWNPDVIFVDSYVSEEESELLRKQVEAIKTDPRWKNISAVKNNRIYIFYDSLISIPGPRMIDLAEKMQVALIEATR